MDKYVKAVAVECKPRNDFLKLLGRNGKLAGPGWMRPYRLRVHPPHADAEQVPCGLAYLPGAIHGALGKIDMGVPACDRCRVRHLSLDISLISTCSFRRYPEFRFTASRGRRSIS